MMSINDFSSRELQKMDIHELRLLARQVGVSSPTSKKKVALIADIVAIITGKAVPELKNINRGRPAKQATSKYSFNNAEYKSMFELGEFEDDFLVASQTGDYSLNKRNAVVCGVVTKQNGELWLKKFKFADTLDDTIISSDLVKLYHLKENDVVSYSKCDNNISIHTINSKPANPCGLITIGEKRIELCKRNIVFASSVTDKRELLLGLQNYGKVVYIPGNNLSVVTSQNITTIPLAVATDEEIINNFCASCDIALYYKKRGGNVIFVSGNFLSVISATKQFESEKSKDLEQEIFARIESLIDCGITFVGIIPSALKVLFSGLSTTFDNIC